jgi:hypothetical protein
MRNSRTIAAVRAGICVALSFLPIVAPAEQIWAEVPVPGISSATTVMPILCNGGFEEGDVGSEPEGWNVPPIPGFKVALTDDSSLVGRQCAVIRRAGSSEGPFGNLVQRVDAKPFRGKRVRFRAGVRAEVNERPNQAQLWLRVDRRTPDGQRAMGAFDNMGDRPITAPQWNYYEIVADVAKDAEQISVGMLLVGQGEAWIDDASFEIVGADVPLTPGACRTGTSLDELKPGLFEVVGGMRIAPTPNIAQRVVGSLQETREAKEPDHVLIPLPLAYRDQVPLSFELTVDPPNAIDAIEIYQDGLDNYVLKAKFSTNGKWEHVDISFKSMVIVGPSDFSGTPVQADIPDVWPAEAQPWLAATWCVDAKHERIKAIGDEIRGSTSDVPEIIRLVLKRAGVAFASAQGQATAMTAVQALDKRGSCTSCANLVAALLRASGVPARIVAGYPSWSGPLQTHYIVEAYLPDYGWYPIESTQCQSPWPNTHQVNVAIIPPHHEEKVKAGPRLGIGAGVPFLSLTEIPVNRECLASRGTIEAASGCDHQCRIIRALQGTPEEWRQAMRAGTSRWVEWCGAEHTLGRDGQIAFRPSLQELAAETVSQLMQDIEED